MKQTLKKAAYSIGSAALLMPALAAAQFVTPSDTGLPTGSITNIITNFMKWLLGIVGVIGVIGFAIAGIMYLTAAGDDDRIKTAKKAMTMSIVGVIVALVGLVAIQAVAKFLGGTDKTI